MEKPALSGLRRRIIRIDAAEDQLNFPQSNPDENFSSKV
jgi:hypothetical protein